MKIDHLMWACADLDAGIAELEQLTGIKAEFSGSHTGMGTRNALMSLGIDCYLEIIAPDPEQLLQGNFGGRLAELKDTGLLSWAVARQDLEGLKAELGDKGIETSRVQTTTRQDQRGELLTWQLLFVKDLPGAPFFIDWLDCLHPAKTSPAGCQIKSLTVWMNDSEAYQRALGAMERLTIRNGDKNPEAVIQCPNGIVTLTPLNTPLKVF
tara:strand:- start:292 stop:921 length:630 start_codon:yes stop_codon:yes gene_type:complete